MQQMIITKHTDNKKIGIWEYDTKNDTIILSDSAASIYYNHRSQRQINIDEFFRILSAKSSQYLSEFLTKIESCESIFTQQVNCENGQSKRVLVIMTHSSNLSENRHGICVDVTKIL